MSFSINDPGYEQLQKIHSGELKAVEVVQSYLDQVAKLNPDYNALISVCSESALKQAQLVDEKVAKGEPLKRLEGLPIILKDMICTKGVATTAASKMLEEFVPDYSATLWERLKEDGAILIGKSNLDEFAMGCSNETSYFNSCKNPWSLEHVPGGSSGGSAASVGLRMSPVSLGTDTGGSIRQPAHFCGVFGIKPTYGRVSRSGVVAFASSFDQVGPVSNFVKDSALVLQSMAGHDLKDETSLTASVPDWFSQTKACVKGKKIGYIKQFFDESEKPIKDAFDKAKDLLEKGGATLEPISLDWLDAIISTYYVLSSAEASSNLARYDGIRYGHQTQQEAKSSQDLLSKSRGEGLGSEVKRRILIGTFCLSEGYAEQYFKKANDIRQALKAQVEQIFKSYDLIACPVSLDTAFKLKERLNSVKANFNNDVCTVLANLCGLPAASCPVSLSDQGLPVGLQFIAPELEEQRLFDTGLFLEQAIEFYKKGSHV